MEVVCHRHFSHSPITTTTSSPTLDHPKSLAVNNEQHSDDSPPPLSNSKLDNEPEAAQQPSPPDLAPAPNPVPGPGSICANGMVECPKCDLVLGSSRSLGGHMTMMHSRNSCKTLKCPKCNWHYKYQETLEIHMKEKHPANDGNACTYCLNKEPHPRLARGENYSCGYKPYKCEICNYSTTTKGNLSIHMQSDKHANNVHELQLNQKKQEEQPPIHEPIEGCSPDRLELEISGEPSVSSPPEPGFSCKFGVKMTPSPSSAKSIAKDLGQSLSNINPGGSSQSKPKRRCRLCGFEAITIRDLRRHMAAGIHPTSSPYLPLPPYLHHPGDTAFEDPAQEDDEPASTTHPYHTIKKMQATAFKPKSSKIKRYPFYDSTTTPLSSSDEEAYRLKRPYGILNPMVGLGFKQCNPSTHCDDQHPQTFLDAQILEYLHRCQSLHAVTLKFKSVLCRAYKERLREYNENDQQSGLEQSAPSPFIFEVRRGHPFFDNVYGCAICYNFSAPDLRLMEFHVIEAQGAENSKDPNAEIESHQEAYLAHIKKGDPENEWQMVYFSGLRGAFKNASASQQQQQRLIIYCNLCDQYFASLAQAKMHESGPRHSASAVLTEILKGKLFPSTSNCSPSSPGSLASQRSSFTFSHFYVRCGEHSLNFTTAFALLKHVAEALAHSASSNPAKLNTIFEGFNLDADCDDNTCTAGLFRISDCRLEKIEYRATPVENLISFPFQEFQYLCGSDSRDNLLNYLMRERVTGASDYLTSEADFGMFPFFSPHGMPLNKSSMLEMALTKPALKNQGLPFSPEEMGDGFNYQKLFAHYMLPQLSSKFSSQTKLSRSDRDSFERNCNKVESGKPAISFVAKQPIKKTLGFKAAFSRDKKIKLIKANNYNMPLIPIRKSENQLSDSNQKDLSKLPNYTQQLTRSPFLTSNKKYLKKKKYSINWLKTICPHCSMCFNKSSILHSHIKRVHKNETHSGRKPQLKMALYKKAQPSVSNDSRPVKISSESCINLTKPEDDSPNSKETDGDGGPSSSYLPQAQVFGDQEMKSFSAFFHYLATCSLKGDGADNPYLSSEAMGNRSSALEKFLDPARPYKCGVCRESFTQKNILLVHYNSVSHLHRLKRSLYLQQSSNQTTNGHDGAINRDEEMTGLELKSSNPNATVGPLDNDKVETKNIPSHRSKNLVITNQTSKYGTNATIATGHRNQNHKHLSPTFDTALANIGIEMVKDYDASEKKLIEEHIKYDNDGGHWFVCKRCGTDDIHLPVRTQSLWKLRDHLESGHGYVIGDDAIESLLSEMARLANPSSSTNKFSKTFTSQQIGSKLHRKKNLMAKRKFDTMMAVCDNDKVSTSDGAKETPKADTSKPEMVENMATDLIVAANIPKENSEQLSIKENIQTVHRQSEKTAESSDNTTKSLGPSREYFPNPLYMSPNDPLAMRMFSLAYPPHQSTPMFNGATTPFTPHHLKDASPHLASPYPFNPDYHLSPFFSPSMSMPFYPPSPSSFGPFGINHNQINPMHHPFMYYPPSNVDAFAATQQTDFFNAAAAAFYNFYYGGSDPSVISKEDRAPLKDDKEETTPPSVYGAQEQAGQIMGNTGNVALDGVNGNNGKRARTRINDDQLKILRSNFDINNSPTEEQIKSMSEKSGLPQKVIKHWFRNTLFKERQRNKDSPYNFNNPPLTRLPISLTSESLYGDLNYDTSCGPDIKDENEFSTPKSFVGPGNKLNGKSPQPADTSSNRVQGCDFDNESKESSFSRNSNVDRRDTADDRIKNDNNCDRTCDMQYKDWCMEETKLTENLEDNDNEYTEETELDHNQASSNELYKNNPNRSFLSKPTKNEVSLNSRSNADAMTEEHMRLMTSADLAAVACGGRRANRTRFSDTQIRILQEYFERNAYPKDDELEKLSKVLGLSPRVIVVWFQNARQKARKHYETNSYNYGNAKSLSPRPFISDNNNNSVPFIGSLHHKSACMDGAKDRYGLEKKDRHYEDIYSQSEDSNDYYQRSDDENEESTFQKHSGYRNTEARSNVDAHNDFGSDYKYDEPSKMQTNLGEIYKNKVKLEPLEQTNVLGGQDKGEIKGEFHCFTESTKGRHIKRENMSPYPLSMDIPLKISLESSRSYKSSNDLNVDETKTERSQSVDSLNVIYSEANHPYSPETVTSNQASLEDNANKKRLRTNISPDQLLYLHRHYQVESNPSKLVMEKIAKDIGLKKRVVQVWFQNARARDKKSNMCSNYPTLSSHTVSSTGKLACVTVGSTPKSTKRCPFCNMFFRARSLLELHVKIKHPSQYADFETVMPPPSTSSSCSTRSISTPLKSGIKDLIAFDCEERDQKQAYEDCKGFAQSIFQSDAKNNSKICHKTRHTSPRRLNAYPTNINQDEGIGKSKGRMDFANKPLVSSSLTQEAEAPLDLSLTSNQTQNIADSYAKIVSTYHNAKKPIYPCTTKFIKAESHETNFLEFSNGEIDNNCDKECVDIDARRKLLRSQNSQLLDLMMNSDSNSIHSTKKGTTVEEIDNGLDEKEQNSFPETSNGQYVLSTLSAVAATCGSSLSNTKRYRTQMNNFQVACMKHIFNDYKTPTMTECEVLGIKIGLPKRVIQVWFQNARAKEKKSKYGYIRTSSFSNEQEWKNATECKLCDVLYSTSLPIQDHVFTDSHIENIKKITGDWDFPASSAHSPYSQTPSSRHDSPHHSTNINELSPSPLSSENSKGSFTWDTNRINGGLPQNNDTAGKESYDTENIVSNGSSKLPQGITQSKALKYLSYLYNNMIVPSPSQISYPTTMATHLGQSTDTNSFALNDFNNYDPLIHGTPLGLLQISPTVLQNIQQLLYNDTTFETTRFLFTQDGSTKKDLLKEAENLVEEVTAEVGFVCRKCLVVYPSEKACLDHVSKYCRYQNPVQPFKSSNPEMAILKLVQKYYKCKTCYAYNKKESLINNASNVSNHHNYHYSTATDFNSHTKTSPLHYNKP